ncbi:uncharacterized protein LOC117151381 isoform X2 [Bombus impatiens]|uniref:Uncharacterized protein LOC117151381 isoform X1 n=1 Tax=Bombus impatiens TaxID=132113 RepID=A0A6P8LPC4_BOMIM|nr:uncharacterized protein LOC117151381 isoform X1 [Bombus impatiens]XP_033175476.1 uncharacterized protein LOC117151381 isoform X2 [Bombus impatiens]
MALADNVVITKLRHWYQKSLLTSYKHFRFRTIQVSYNSIVCNSVEHVKFCAWKLRFADSIDFLLPFEENCCRIASNACQSFTVSILLVNRSALNGLKNSEVAILTRGTKNAEDYRKSFETANCKHRWMRMTLKRNNNSLID